MTRYAVAPSSASLAGRHVKERAKKIVQPTSDELRAAVAAVKNKTYLEILLFGNSRQGRPAKLVARIEAEGIDTSHWTDRFVRRPQAQKKPLTEINKSNVRKRIIAQKLIEEKCAECGLPPLWQGKRLALHIDHINGDSTDHRLENLRFLCPNCHQQTETWGGASTRKLPRDDSILIELHKTKTRVEVAQMFGVTVTAVSNRLRKYNV